MEHAKRMVLVPEENLRHILLPPNFHSTVQTPGNASTRLDRQMSDVMSSESFANEREKWLEYQRVLEQFLRSKNAKKSVAPTTTTTSNDDAEKKKKQTKPREVITIPSSSTLFFRASPKVTAAGARHFWNSWPILLIFGGTRRGN